MADLKTIISKVPNKPGVYKYLDNEGEVIYVGKAKDLKKRVKSYFQKNKDHGPKHRALVARIEDIEYIVVESDLEAIMLETNLIKEIRPKYNVLMKDDKNFVYIKITTNEEYPKIYLTRKLQKDGATYFGPKTSGIDIKNTVKLVSSLLPYPKCQINIEWTKDNKITTNQSKKPPCVFKQIDPDHKPCIADLSTQDYQEFLSKIIDFFKGRHGELIKTLEKQMLEFAQNKEFEKAAILRDRLFSLQKVIEKQNISGTNNEELDVIDIVYSEQKYFANLFQVREGKLISQENFILPSNGLSEEISTAMQEIFNIFLQQYYSQTADIPKRILIPEPLDNKSEVENWLSQIKSSTVKIEIPQAGKKHDLIKLATKNAEQYAKLMKVKWMSESNRSSEKVLPELKELLNLKKNPKRIECYDISHLQGNYTVGSMVVFEDGKAKKEDYRYFNIKELLAGEINDFDSLKEVLTRRLKYIASLPENHRLKKTATSYQLISKKQDTPAFEIEYTEDDKSLCFKPTPDQIKLLTTNPQQIDLAEIFIKKIIQKHKLNRYLIATQNSPELETLATKIGFIPIENPNYNFGYYPQKQVFDASFTAKPDLIIIDGGKGQLSSALKAKKHYNSNIPFISIAKKLEEIFLEDKERILLPFNSPILNLVQQMRDEAHRFAITKNRKDRIKNMLKS